MRIDSVSGIYGMVRFDGAAVTREMLEPMAGAMSFWGPDGHGQWRGDSAGLGHLMLHVTPESLHERLPASISAAPHLVITADARIDNRDELFDALGVPGTGRARTPDSSLILLAYERWGTDCVKRLLGDFAFAIWDSRKRTLFCARDLFGCMPFLYHSDGKRFVFASGIKGVLAQVESPKLNEPLLAAYLQFRTYNAQKRYTFFEEIVKLPPAHTLLVSRSGLQLSRYWSPEDAAEVRLGSDQEYAERMRVLFEESVRCRLRSAFPIGSHLSGGLDSTSVTAMAARVLREKGEGLATFAWAPPPEPGQILEPGSVEAKIAAVCEAEGLTCYYLPVTHASYLDVFQRDVTVEPTEMMPLERNVQSCASDLGLRVMLSGWGGDEAASMRGGSTMSEFFQRGQWHDLWRVVKARNAAAPGRSFHRVRTLAGSLRSVATPWLPDFLYFRIQPRPWLQHESPCIQPSFATRHRRAVKELRGPAFRQSRDARSTMCHFLNFGHLTRRIEDWNSSGAQHRLTYRYPLLDKRVVEFAVGSPATQFAIFGPGSGLLRRAVSGILPESCDWGQRKDPSRAMREMERTFFKAYSEWARVIAGITAPGAVRFVDPQKIQSAIEKPRSSNRIGILSGIREAFSCFSSTKMCEVEHDFQNIKSDLRLEDRAKL